MPGNHPSYPRVGPIATCPAHRVACPPGLKMTGTITSIENTGGPLVTVVVQCGGRERIVPVGSAAWATMVRAHGPGRVIGAAVEVSGSGAAATLTFESSAT